MKKEIMKFDAPELQIIEQSKADKIKKTFEPMAKMLSEFEDMYNNIITESKEEITEEITTKAKRLRLDIGKVRIETGKLKDKQKEYIKLEDKAIMGVHNILVWAVKEKEDKLKEIENHFEIQEQKRLEKLQQNRAEKLSKYVENAFELNLSIMEDDVFNAYYQTKKKEHEDRIEAEKKAEKERLLKEKAEEEERKRIAVENEKLKKEAEERERIYKIEEQKRIALEKERVEKEEKERKQREEKERIQLEKHEAELKKQREEKERIEKEAREKQEKLEAQIKAKEEKERKEYEEKEKALQAELNKNDKAKVLDLLNDLELIKSKYSFKSSKNQKMYKDVSLLIDKTINFINPDKKNNLFN